MANQEREDEYRPEKGVKELEEEVALALGVWKNAGKVGGGILKERLGGGVFANAQRLIANPILERYSARGTEDLGILLEPTGFADGEIRELTIFKGVRSYSFKAVVFYQGGKEGGFFDVVIRADSDGKVKNILYDLDLWRQEMYQVL